MTRRTWRLRVFAGSVVLAAGLTTGFATLHQANATVGGSVLDLQILAINDFHGNLEPPQGSAGNITKLDASGNRVTVPAGGAEYLATHLAAARAGLPRSVTVAAGDLIGATPLLSAAFHDEPTIRSMDALKLDISAVGNHEFDEGRDELLRMQYGGCHPTDGCYDPNDPFRGARFRYLAANVVHKGTSIPMLPPFWIKNMGGARVGFIGMTLEATPDIVTRDGIKDLEFKDEVQTANRYVKLLRLFGVKAIVVLLHEGGSPASPVFDYDCDTPMPGGGVSGPIVDIARNLDPQIDLLVTGHTHQSYVCTIPDPAGQPRLVTSASSFGKLYTDIRLSYDRRHRDISRASVAASNKIVTRDVAKDPAQTALVTRYGELVAPIANRVVGHISADILGRGSGRLESPLGDVIADAQLEATAAPGQGGAQIAFMNPGGIRADLAYRASGAEGDGVVTYGEAFTVQPFNNFVVTMDLTGAQLVTLLRQQMSEANEASPRILQPSRGFTYTIDLSRTGADRILADTVRLDGAPIDPARVYRVEVNSFLSDGGDGFAVLREGGNKLFGGLDIDAFANYLTAHSSPAAPLAPPPANRITVLP